MGEINFTTQSKLALMTNNLPRFNAADKAMTDRVVVLPFHAVFTNNPYYKDRLLQNLDEIFSYIVSGGVDFWKTRKVDRIPTVVQNEIDSYYRDNDVVGQFVSECCELVYNGQEKANDIYEAYNDWSQENQVLLLSKNKFFSILEKKFTKQRTRSGMLYRGLRIALLE
jgi:putative DNA primase/helicase